MTANVRVVTDQRESVLKVPNSALRMRIAGVEPVADVNAPAGAKPARTPGAEGKPQRPAADGAARSSTRGRVYVLDAKGQAQAFSVRVGISDGTSSELLLAPESAAAAQLTEGAEVIVGLKSAGSGPARSSTAGPRSPF